MGEMSEEFHGNRHSISWNRTKLEKQFEVLSSSHDKDISFTLQTLIFVVFCLPEYTPAVVCKKIHVYVLLPLPVHPLAFFTISHPCLDSPPLFLTDSWSNLFSLVIYPRLPGDVHGDSWSVFITDRVMYQKLPKRSHMCH